jgi:hypothetical protein
MTEKTLLQKRKRLVNSGLQTCCIFSAGSGIKRLSAAAALNFATFEQSYNEPDNETILTGILQNVLNLFSKKI